MENKNSELLTTTKTFRFASGQLLIFNDDQIAKIPYLFAMISAADNFKSVCDEQGYFKLDPYVEFKHFSFVIESLSFRSVRQIFTRLPKEDDVLEIIALFDFLGIGPQSDLTLDEIDSAFFSQFVYSPLLDDYVQIINPPFLQDMAVRFGIAVIKEQYDFTNCQIIDQIYWYTMFILTAQTFFGPRLRHHLFKIAEYCFSLFSPSLLKPLKNLLSTTMEYARKSIWIKSDRLIEQRLHDDTYLDCWSDLWRPTVQLRRSLLNRTLSDHSYWRVYVWNEEQLFKPLCCRIVETMYEGLQSEICRQTKAEINGRRHQYVQKENYAWISGRILGREIVQEEIRKFVVNEICALIPQVEATHKNLVEKIRHYEQNFRSPFVFYSYAPNLEEIKSLALFCELMLDKLHQHSFIIEEQTCQDIVKKLDDLVIKQITEWKNRQKEIAQLKLILSVYRTPEELLKSIFPPICQNDWPSVNRPLPKIQSKHSAR